MKQAKGAPPEFVPPQLCRIVSEPPRGPRWIHEIKLDGYRMQLRVAGHRATLRTRKGLDWSARFAEIVQDGNVLPDCLIDGEVAALDEDGVSSFADLQAALSDGETAKLVFFVFDLLFLDGRDLRNAPLAERKQALKQLLRQHLAKSRRFRFVDALKLSGEAPLDMACRMNLEGVISKRADAPYRSGRSEDWTKAKCRAGQEVVIGGWWGDANKLRSLLVGVHYQGQFVYLGRVGTGFNTRSAADVLARLKPLEQPRTPFAPHAELPRGSGIHWVRPQVVAEIEFGTFTTAGLLRQASFKGLREDKPAAGVVPEAQPAAARQSGSKSESGGKSGSKTRMATVKPSGKHNLVVAGISISHPDKVLWPATKTSPAFTKADLARYYEKAASRMLPHIADRPISIVRAPNGIEGQRFFQRHLMPGSDPHLLPVKVSGEKEPYIALEDKAGLVALAQAAVLELHPWGSKPGEPEVPGRIIFDLDPAPDVRFDTVIEAAKDLGARLKRLGFKPFVKTTGGKGLHVVVAIKGTPKSPVAWAEAKAFARDVCRRMEEDEPSRFTTNMSKSVRGGKIFLDFLRNDRTSTAVAPWSPRARPGATISLPLPWSKLRKGLDPARFTLANAAKLLRGADPWKNLDRTAIALSAARKKLGRI